MVVCLYAEVKASYGDYVAQKPYCILYKHVDAPQCEILNVLLDKNYF